MRITTGAIVKRAVDMIMWILLAYLILEAAGGCAKRIHGYVWTENAIYTESGKELDNPNRGFYLIYSVVPSEEGETFSQKVLERLAEDERTLAMIQINLRNYTEGAISEKGLQSIEEVFRILSGYEKQYLVRFLYDWDGNNKETEPQDVEIILTHMRQLDYIFREYEDIIFVQQGLFIGNWGEMNGTKHLDFIQQLALQLEAVTGENTFLSVRTPAHWRIITGFSQVTKEALAQSSLLSRLGLYNDGMLGNESDCGTYGTKSKEEIGPFEQWNRAEELAFQNELCRFVPNGGEVIKENPLNNFESAVDNLATMHVSYLNWDYDRDVLNKWKETTVTEEGCFYGMDGLTYMDRHLGYRLLISKTSMKYDFWPDELHMEVELKNVGFAPLYRDTDTKIVIRKKNTEEVWEYPIAVDWSSLPGGAGEKLLTVAGKISLVELEPGEYSVYFSVKDVATGSLIEFANEQEAGEWGYLLGEFQVDELPELSEVLEQYKDLRRKDERDANAGAN